MRWTKRAIAKRANLRHPIFMVAVLCSAAFVLSSAARAQSDCKTLHDATLTAVPSHAYESETNPARPGEGATNHEIIRTGGTIYVMINGKWKKSPLSEAQMRSQEEENWKTAKNVSCKHLRDESVNGQSAAVYSMHSETDDTKADGQVWISRSKGLILRQEEDIDTGDGDKRHHSIRYEYTNVQTPAVSP